LEEEPGRDSLDSSEMHFIFTGWRYKVSAAREHLQEHRIRRKARFPVLHACQKRVRNAKKGLAQRSLAAAGCPGTTDRHIRSQAKAECESDFKSRP